jgi:hypothetical protein
MVRGERQDVADHDLVGERGVGGEHLHAVQHHAGVGLARHAQRRHLQARALVELRVARALRRQDRVHQELVLVAHLLPHAQEVVLVAAGLIEDLRLHRHAGDGAGAGVRRAPEHAAAEIRDHGVRRGAAHQILAAARAQEMHAVALAVLLVAHHLAQLALPLQVVERGPGACRIAQRGMRGGVRDALLGEVHDAPVAEALQVLGSGLQHA